MIRTVLIAAGFLIVTIGLIAMQPTLSGRGDTEFSDAVTRGTTDLTNVAPVSNDIDPTGSQVAAMVKASLGQTETQTPAVVAEITAPTPAQQIASLDTGSVDLENLTYGVLANLNAIQGNPANAPPPSQDKEMRALTDGILIGLREALPDAKLSDKSLAHLVARAMQEDQADSYVDFLISEANSGGVVAVLAQIKTPQSASSQRQRERIKESLIYTVSKGDSLGVLAQRFTEMPHITR